MSDPCPCAGTCHEAEGPCSLDCVEHDDEWHMINGLPLREPEMCGECAMCRAYEDAMDEEFDSIATKYELDELKAEVGRHHESFASISSLLDEFFGGNTTDPVAVLQTIRGIVG